MILTEKRGALAIATLNRESSLNTLNLEMVRSLYDALKAWEQDPAVHVIAIRGAGAKSFCSGGDVKTVVLEAQKGNEQYALDFFTNEYRLDHAIYRCKKPVVVIGHGYLMGGGLGLFAGAAGRVVTDSTVASMPELAIGLFPDVGASYFLNKLPGHAGLFLALTGARLKAADLLFAKLANAYVPDSKLDALLESLERLPLDGELKDRKKALRLHLKRFAKTEREALPNSTLETHLDVIESFFDPLEPLTVFRKLLTARGQLSTVPWLAQALESFSHGSPTSAFLMFEQLRRALPLSLESCYRMDLDLAIQCVRRSEFREGVRALLIDKDKAPKWNPARHEDVEQAEVLEHFKSPWPAAAHPLRDLEE